MADEHAGIYYHPKAEVEYDKLPDESQDRLSDFLELERQVLEASGGGNREGLAAEWEPGHFVFWDIKLRPPQFPKALRASARSARTIGSFYRIEVLVIR